MIYLASDELRVVLYDWLCFEAVSPASLLTATVADGPHPPLVDRTREVQVLCSTSRILLSYALLFSCSCLL